MKHTYTIETTTRTIDATSDWTVTHHRVDEYSYLDLTAADANPELVERVAQILGRGHSYDDAFDYRYSADGLARAGINYADDCGDNPSDDFDNVRLFSLHRAFHNDTDESSELEAHMSELDCDSNEDLTRALVEFIRENYNPTYVGLINLTDHSGYHLNLLPGNLLDAGNEHAIRRTGWDSGIAFIVFDVNGSKPYFRFDHESMGSYLREWIAYVQGDVYYVNLEVAEARLTQTARPDSERRMTPVDEKLALKTGPEYAPVELECEWTFEECSIAYGEEALSDLMADWGFFK